MNVEDNVSTDRLSIRDRIRLLKSRTSSGYSSTSSLSFKSHESKDNTIIDFKGRSSTLIPEQQRPESAGRRMNEWRTRSTDNLRSNDKWDILHLRLKRTKSMSQSPDFKESSNLSPEQQRPESAGRRMDEWRKRSTDRLRSTDICDIPLKRLKRTKSMSEIHDFKESSNLSPEQQRPESAGRRMDVEDNWSTDRLSIRDRIRLFKCRSLPIYSDFKKSSSLREKDTSLSTTPEIVVAGGMETT